MTREARCCENLRHHPREGGDQSPRTSRTNHAGVTILGGASWQGAVEDEEVGVSGYEVVDVADESGGKDVGVGGITPLTTKFVSTSTRIRSRRLVRLIALFADGFDLGGDVCHELVGVHVPQLFANGFDGCHQTRRSG